MGHYLSEMENNDLSEYLQPKKKVYSINLHSEVHSIKDKLKEIPLVTRLYVLNDMMILTYLVDNGFIPEGFWNDEKETKYGKKLHKFAKQLAKWQIKEMKQWEKDGIPK